MVTRRAAIVLLIKLAPTGKSYIVAGSNLTTPGTPYMANINLVCESPWGAIRSNLRKMLDDETNSIRMHLRFLTRFVYCTQIALLRFGRLRSSFHDADLAR